MTHDPTLDELAGKFFHVFQRTEYALKASGFNNHNGEAKANWRDFALSLEKLIENPTTPDLRMAIDFILNAPPKKQMVFDGVIKWEVSEPKTNSQADKLLIYIRRVRK